MACSLKGIPWKSSTIGHWSRLECLNCVICVENNNRVHWSILLLGFSVRVLLMLFLFLCLSVDLHMFDNLCVGVSEKMSERNLTLMLTRSNRNGFCLVWLERTLGQGVCFEFVMIYQCESKQCFGRLCFRILACIRVCQAFFDWQVGFDLKKGAEDEWIVCL